MEFLSAAGEAARLGGRVLTDWAGRYTVSEKSPANLVTEADLASQEAIHGLLRDRFPDHGFLGEEGLSQPAGDSSYRWIIDPLDGTSNYVHRFPYYAVSIAREGPAADTGGERSEVVKERGTGTSASCDSKVSEAKAGASPLFSHNQALLVGVVYDPNRDEMFATVRGRGATLNGRPLRVSKAAVLAEAMVVASLPLRPRPDDPAVRRFVHVLPRVQTLQRTGSAALNLAYLAAGRIDAYWSSTLRPWDMAAGALLVMEAGGRVTKADGRPLDIEVPDLLSSNGSAIHEELAQLLNPRDSAGDL